MWNNAENQPIENIENYLEAIKSAKSKLNEINVSICNALKERDEILKGNSDILKQKLDEIKSSHENCIQLQNESQKILESNNKIHLELNTRTAELSESIKKHDADLAKHQHEVNDFIIRQDNFNVEMSTKTSILDDREKSIVLRELDYSNLVAELQKSIDLHKSDVIKLEYEKSMLEQKINEVSEMTLKASSSKSEAKALMEDASSKLEAAFNKFQEAICKEETNEAEAKKIIADRESLKDMIIECKKAKVEAEKAKEDANNFIAQANQRIAELNELKSVLAAQGE